MGLLPFPTFLQIIDYQKDIRIAMDRRFKYCPNNQCTSLLRVNGQIISQKEGKLQTINKNHPANIICPNCYNNFCFECDKPAHWPASCEDAEWFIKESAKLINQVYEAAYYVARVKKCPQCKMPMEKNEGCQHMTCRCSHQFCWECLQDWASHVANPEWKCSKAGGKVKIEVWKL